MAARWPELCSVAHLALLDTERASNVTADALARLNRTWNDVVDAGRPGEQARAAVLGAALHAAPATPAALDVSGDADSTDDPVVTALVVAIRTAPPIERALLATDHLWDLNPDAVSHLLQQSTTRGRATRDTDAAVLTDHAASLEARLTAAHDAAHLAEGRDPSPWRRDRDVTEAIDHLLRDTHDPPDPAALVTTRTTGISRRILLTAGATTLALTAAGATLVSRGGGDTPSMSATTAAPLDPEDPRWASATQWTPRGPLADDPAVIALALRSVVPRYRRLRARHIATHRAVPLRSYSSAEGTDNDGYTDESWLTYSQPFVAVFQGPRGMDPARLTPRILVTGGNLATSADGDVVAVTLAPDPEGPAQAALVVLARPTVQSASVSSVLRPRADGTTGGRRSLLCAGEPLGVRQHPGGGPHRGRLGSRTGLVDDLPPQLDEQLGDVDPHGARVEARAAQAGGVGQRLVDRARRTPQLGVEHGTDRPRVHRAVGVAAGALVDRADVEARGAADAAQRLAPDAVGEHVAAAVVEEDDVHLPGSVTVVDTGPHRRVRVHPLTRARAGKQLEHRR